MDENELRRKMQAGELAANNGTVMRTLAIAGCDFKFLKLKSLLLALAGGGAFAYVKFIKPKQGVKVSADPDDYDFEDEEYLTEDESGDIKDN